MMNLRLPIVQISVTLLISQLIACGSLSFPAADPVKVSISTAIPVDVDPASARLVPELVWEISGDPNALDVPVGVAADAEGNIYVMDTNNFRIQKFDSKGKFLVMWGSEGSGEGQFGDSLDAHDGHLAVDTQGNVYVIDLKNVRIQKFDNNGNYLTQWGTEGPGEGQFTHPFDIAIDQQNNIYISDVGSNTIQKFDPAGQFLLRWGKTGYNNGEFSDVYSVAIAPDGNVLVTDSTGRIQKFDSNGQFISTIMPESVDNQGVFLWNIAVDNQGDIYVADWYGNRIVKLDPEGKALAAWSASDVGVDWFVNVQDIAVDQQGNIYLSDSTEDLIRKFRQPAFHP
ncbi:MAG TPA: 6-bladed beta-propeller [Anaerolineales bacterium]|nr:6-bladed beta-propeller [Anaerolineales bacterium]